MFPESGFVVLQGTTYWTDLFVRHFLFQEEQSIDCDDLLFFVRKRHVKGSSRYLPKYEVSSRLNTNPSLYSTRNLLKITYVITISSLHQKRKRQYKGAFHKTREAVLSWRTNR